MGKKTYGAYGYVDYEITLNIGGAQARASFSGGSISAYGVTPAEFATSNPVVQYALERTASFKRGTIKLLRQEAEAEPARQAKAPEAEEAKEFEAATLEDAVEMLRGYGYRSHALRSKAACEEAAKNSGIALKWV